MFSENIDLELKKRAKMCCAKGGIKGMDWEDIWQELRLAYFQASEKFDPQKSSERTYANRIADKKIADLLRYSTREKRGGGKKDISLDELLDKGVI